MTLSRTLFDKYVFTSENLLEYKGNDNTERNYMNIDKEIRADFLNLFAFIYADVVSNKKVGENITAQDLDYYENFECEFKILPHAHVVITIFCNTKKEFKFLRHYDQFTKINEVSPLTKDLFDALREDIYRDDLPF